MYKYYMQALKEKEIAGTNAVKRLRKQKLKQGHPFMINSKTLPQGQFYIEFPSGIIKLAVISESKKDYIILRELSTKEIAFLRTQYGLY
jgi:hypothetical protein